MPGASDTVGAGSGYGASGALQVTSKARVEKVSIRQVARVVFPVLAIAGIPTRWLALEISDGGDQRKGMFVAVEGSFLGDAIELVVVSVGDGIQVDRQKGRHTIFTGAMNGIHVDIGQRQGIIGRPADDLPMSGKARLCQQCHEPDQAERAQISDGTANGHIQGVNK